MYNEYYTHNAEQLQRKAIILKNYIQYFNYSYRF